MLALAGAAMLSGCGAGDAATSGETSEDLTSAPGASATAPGEPAPAPDAAAGDTPTPDAALADAYGIASLCDLLGVADVEIAADGLGWGVVGEAPAECVYQDPDATHTVTLTLTSLAAYEAMNGAAVDAGASGMQAVATDGYMQIWAPAGLDAALVLTQRPSALSEGAMVALTENAALAFENLP